VTTLLDANVLIALVVADHVHHDAAEEWFAGSDGSFATCPITQGSLLRLLIREGQTADDARAILNAVNNSERHEFWPDSVTYSDVPLHGVLGHRQVTDSYLAQLARAQDGRLATFDHGLAKLHTDIADLLPTTPAQPSR
jgi:toxin-antitoxin system PIN domain toxin